MIPAAHLQNKNRKKLLERSPRTKIRAVFDRYSKIGCKTCDAFGKLSVIEKFIMESQEKV